MKEINWRLIIFSAIGAAVGINVLILLLIAALLYGGFFSDRRVAGVEEFLLLFAVFSPLVASLVSCGFVTYHAKTKKLLHTIFSTIITFALATAVLFYATSPLAVRLYAAIAEK
jgi:FtsH-binding integral membrane protein